MEDITAAFTSVHFESHFIGATLEFRVSISDEENPSVYHHTSVCKQFYWSKDTAQEIFDFTMQFSYLDD